MSLRNSLPAALEALQVAKEAANAVPDAMAVRHIAKAASFLSKGVRILDSLPPEPVPLKVKKTKKKKETVYDEE